MNQYDEMIVEKVNARQPINGLLMAQGSGLFTWDFLQAFGYAVVNSVRDEAVWMGDIPPPQSPTDPLPEL